MSKTEADLIQLRAENDALKALLAQHGIAAPLPSNSDIGDSALQPTANELSPNAKVKLFRRLFRGREDIYPVRWISKTTGKPGGFDETGFSGRMDPLVRERKEMSKGILTSAALIKKVLLSAARCETEECQYLALTTDERRRLGAGLDQFARDNFQWGMKEGQSTFDASVAVIREVLEDPVFFSKEK